MLKLYIQKASELEKNIKVTAHSSGKLGFSESAAKKLDLANKKSLIIATNEDEEDGDLYMWPSQGETEEAFKVCRAGEYYYLNTKLLLEKLKIDYTNKDMITIFDIIDFKYEGNNIYKLLKRVQPRTKTKKADASDN